MKFKKLLSLGAIAALALTTFGASAAQAVVADDDRIGALAVPDQPLSAGERFTVTNGPGTSWVCRSNILVEIDGNTFHGTLDYNTGNWSAEVVAPATGGTHEVNATCEAFYADFPTHYDPATISVVALPPAPDPVPLGECSPAPEFTEGFQYWPEGALTAETQGTLDFSVKGDEVTVKLHESCADQAILGMIYTGGKTGFFTSGYANADAVAVFDVADRTQSQYPQVIAPGTYKFAVHSERSELLGWTTLTKSDAGVWSLAEGDSDTTPAAPAAPAESSLTAANAGSVTISNISGNNVRLNVGTSHAGKTVFGTVFSTPAPLGSAVVNAQGLVTFTLPSGLAAGTHKIAVQSQNGDIIGWVSIALSNDGTWSAVSLANTGSDAGSVALTVGSLLAAAGVLTLVVRRVRATVTAAATQ